MCAAKRTVVSWSGGKDSTMALLRARDAGDDVCALFTMFSPEDGTSRSHGLPEELLQEQATALGLPLYVGHAGWPDYEEEFKCRLGALVADGIERAVFGDIFLDDHKAWVDRVCAEIGCEASEPLWGEPTDQLVAEALDVGIRARICTLDRKKLPADVLGRYLDHELVAEFGGRGIDPCGEYGEYHTVVLECAAYGCRIVVDEAVARLTADHAHWHIQTWHTATC